MPASNLCWSRKGSGRPTWWSASAGWCTAGLRSATKWKQHRDQSALSKTTTTTSSCSRRGSSCSAISRCSRRRMARRAARWPLPSGQISSRWTSKCRSLMAGKPCEHVARPSLQTESRRPAHHGAHRLCVLGKINRLAERQLRIPTTSRELRRTVCVEKWPEANRRTRPSTGGGRIFFGRSSRRRERAPAGHEKDQGRPRALGLARPCPFPPRRRGSR